VAVVVDGTQADHTEYLKAGKVARVVVDLVAIVQWALEGPLTQVQVVAVVDILEPQQILLEATAVLV
jgi:hypothetical protein